MTATQIAAVAHTAANPAQRPVGALVAVHAARTGAIRESTQRLSECAHGPLLDWLQHRRRTWPHPDLISTATATGIAPISDYYSSSSRSTAPRPGRGARRPGRPAGRRGS